jgi:multiple sugar transport system substrate-binding protein
MTTQMSRQQFLRAGAVGLAGVMAAGALAPERGIAATRATAAITGNLEVWDWSPAPDKYGEAQQAAFYKWFPTQYPHLHFSDTIYGYTDLLPKLEVAFRGGGGPDVTRAAIAWSPQFVNEDMFEPLTPARLSQLGLSIDDFWPQALQTVRKAGQTSAFPLYGLPTNNEAMLLIYNKGLFRQAGLDPRRGPDTWEALASYSRTIHAKTGKYGYGLVAVLNNGNTPFRFCPVMWAYGGGIFDELTAHPTWRKVGINSPGTVAALALYNRMYNVDKSVPPSALSDQESDMATLFLAGKVAMIIDHPSAAAQVHQLAPHIDLGGALLPRGPVRRAVVFGGSNVHIRKRTRNLPAALAFVKAYESPNWNARLAGLGSNPGNRQGFHTAAEKQRDKMLLFNNVTLEMMKYGVNVPLVAQGAQIWNQTIPSMIQRVLTKKQTPQQSAAQAESEIKGIMAS